MRLVVEAPSLGLRWQDGVDRLTRAALGSFPRLVNLDDESRPVTSVKRLVSFLEGQTSVDDDDLPTREVTLRTEAATIGIHAPSDHPSVPVWNPFRMWIDLDDRYCGARWQTARGLLLTLATDAAASYGAILGCGRKIHDAGTDLTGRPKVGWVTCLSAAEYDIPAMEAPSVTLEHSNDRTILTVDPPWDLTDVESLARLREVERALSREIGVPHQLLRRLQSLGIAADDAPEAR